MDIQQSYDLWSGQYDQDANKTRDLEALAIRDMLQLVSANHCLELGCGTGKNTEWLQKICRQVIAVDGSAGMLAIHADILAEWSFIEKHVDLVVCSLVLEHVENMQPIFQKASASLNADGLLYIGELHPFKQYQGSQARFHTSDGLHVLTCYTHHVADYVSGAMTNGFSLQRINEFFDEGDPAGIPRIMSLLFRKR
jgi:ubiquinone/menaquinone biosynthesis C-methylase UbiE